MTAADEKTFDARVVGSITTGVLLLEGGFSKMHEAFVHILGHPVWTHELAQERVWEAARAIVATHHPGFPAGKPDDWKALADRLSHDYPDGVTLPRGHHERTEGPIESLCRVLAESEKGPQA